ITLCGLAAQVSKFAQFNGGILLALFVCWTFWRSSPHKHPRFAVTAVVMGMILGIALSVAAFKTGKYIQIGERWKLLLTHQPEKAPASGPQGFAMHPNRFLEST